MRIFILSLFMMASFSMSAQVILDSYLQEDHRGKLPDSEWFNGEQLNYRFQFVSAEKGVEYENKESIQKINYKLHLGKGDERQVFRVVIRDLIVTTYFEIDLDHGPDATVISAIYNKRNRWVKMKGVVEADCRRSDMVWSRLDQVKDFDQLLKFIVKDLDQNVDLSCFNQ